MIKAGRKEGGLEGGGLVVCIFGLGGCGLELPQLL